MVDEVTVAGTTFAQAPTRFEAGTPSIVPAIALGAAVEFLQSIGMDRVRAHEHALLKRALQEMSDIPGVRVIGPVSIASMSEVRAGVISIAIDGIHAHDAAHALALRGVCVRAGNHCAQPLHKALGIDATLRMSIGVYTTSEDIDRFIEGVRSLVQRD